MWELGVQWHAMGKGRLTVACACSTERDKGNGQDVGEGLHDRKRSHDHAALPITVIRHVVKVTRKSALRQTKGSCSGRWPG